MNILVTGFGPFPGVADNLSQDVVSSLPAAIGDADVLGCVLPTEYEAGGRLIEALLKQRSPDVCLCTGVAPGNNLRLEALARNACSAEAPDQAGVVRQGQIESNGPETYRSTLPLERIETALAAAGHPVDRSEDAGGYVCNFVFYRARHTIDQQGLSTVCGFLHLPALAPPGLRASQLDRIRDAIRVLVNCL